MRRNRVVLTADVATFARKDCRACWGKGFLGKHVNGKRQCVLCGCAESAFASVQAERTEPSHREGGRTWRPGRAPEEEGFTQAWWAEFDHQQHMRAFAENATRRQA